MLQIYRRLRFFAVRCEAPKMRALRQQRPELGRRAVNLRVEHSLQPEHRLVGFFGNDSELRDEFVMRPGAPRCAIVRCGGCGGVLILAADALGYPRVRQALNKPDGEICERVGSCLKFVGLTHGHIEAATGVPGRLTWADDQNVPMIRSISR